MRMCYLERLQETWIMASIDSKTLRSLETNLGAITISTFDAIKVTL